MNNIFLTMIALTAVTATQLVADTPVHKGWWIGYHKVSEENICAHGGEGGCPGIPKPPITPENSVLGGFTAGSKGFGFLRIDTTRSDGSTSHDAVTMLSTGSGKLTLEMLNQSNSDSWWPKNGPGPGWTMQWNDYNGVLVYENDEHPYYRKASITFFYLDPDTISAAQPKSD